MFGALDGLNSVGRIADIIEKLMADTQIREKFESTGEITGLVRLEEYELAFTLRRHDDE